MRRCAWSSTTGVATAKEVARKAMVAKGQPVTQRMTMQTARQTVMGLVGTQKEFNEKELTPRNTGSLPVIIHAASSRPGL
jgi:hypothetical protein